MQNQKNLILAFALSLLVMLVYDRFYAQPKYEAEQARIEAQQAQGTETNGTGGGTLASQGDDLPDFGDSDQSADSDLPGYGQSSVAPAPQSATDNPTAAPEIRIPIETPKLEGSISLRGGRIDDVLLHTYLDRQGEGAEDVHLLNPKGQEDAYFAQMGWLPRNNNSGATIPGPNTDWQVSGSTLTPTSPLELTFDNGEGLVFKRIISIDEDFLFTITQRVENSGGNAVVLKPYGLLDRIGRPDSQGLAIMHEGGIGVFNGELDDDYGYGDLEDGDTLSTTTTGGWFGLTDKYWAAAFIPDQSRETDVRFSYDEGQNRFRVDYRYDEIIVAAGERYEVTTHLFAGAKEVNVIDRYEVSLEAPLLDRVVDWGMWYFLTKPLFFALQFFQGFVGNYGVAIILLTISIRILMYPVMNKQFAATAKMGKVAPQMKELKERYKDNPQRMQQETSKLYKEAGFNPLGCLIPMLIQIPVFFALYKMLYISIELRHQPFFGWVTDLSEADPLTPINLFGLLPFDPPSFIAIGIWPIIMGLSMWVQQKLNPAPPDPMQAKMMMMLPIFITFIMAPFPVGVVIYWTFSNILGIGQQWLIKKRMAD